MPFIFDKEGKAVCFVSNEKDYKALNTGIYEETAGDWGKHFSQTLPLKEAALQRPLGGMVDTRDLKSLAARRASSSLAGGTNKCWHSSDGRAVDL